MVAADWFLCRNLVFNVGKWAYNTTQVLGHQVLWHSASTLSTIIRLVIGSHEILPKHSSVSGHICHALRLLLLMLVGGFGWVNLLIYMLLLKLLKLLLGMDRGAWSLLSLGSAQVSRQLLFRPKMGILDNLGGA